MKRTPSDVPDLVVRPSGVWDTRAPFHNYLVKHRNLEQVVAASMLSLRRVKAEVESAVPDLPAKPFFSVNKGDRGDKHLWQMLRDSTPGKNVSVAQIRGLIAKGSQALIDQGIIRFTSLFETYLQSWTLNYLIARLEADIPWTSAERRLAQRFWPIPGASDIPSVPQIVSVVLPLRELLTSMPHVNQDLRSDQAVASPVTSGLNALTVILFWRAFRNLLVHHGGIVSTKFFARHVKLYDEMLELFPYMVPLTVGKRLVVLTSQFAAIATTQYKAAITLSMELEKLSAGRRGHPFAPGPRPAKIYFEGPPPLPPKFLVTGDHELSCRWMDDRVFREQLNAMFRPQLRHA